MSVVDSPVEIDRPPDAANVSLQLSGWLSAIPAAAVVAAALIWLAPWIVHRLPTPDLPRLVMSNWLPDCRPEPLEDMRYLLAIALGPMVCLAGVLGWWRRSKSKKNGTWLIGVAVAVQVVLTAAAIAAARHFIQPARMAAVVLVASVLIVLYWRGWRIGRRWIDAAAVVLTAALLLCSLQPSGTVGESPMLIHFHLPFTSGDFAAVVNGRTPLVDYFPMYSTVLPYLLAPVFHVVGMDSTTFTTAMTALSFVGLLALYGTLLSVTKNRAWALALYLVVLGSAFWPVESLGTNIGNNFNYYGVAPIRYIGPWIVTALCGWYAAKPSARRAAILGCAAALTAMNNLDFGLPALGATAIVVLAAARNTRWRLIAMFVVGCALAVAAFIVLTVTRSGQLPSPKLLLDFQRAFAFCGIYLVLLPAFDLYWAIYLTWVAAIVAGAICLIGGDDARRRAGALLVFTGIFGLGAAGYYVGRSSYQTLMAILPTWAFALGLLAWVAARPLVLRWSTMARSEKALRIVPAGVAILGCVLCLSHISVVRPITADIRRLTAPADGYYADRDAMEREIAARTHSGETVMVIFPYGHEMAQRAGVNNVFPFTHPQAMMLRDQLDVVTQVVQRQHVTKIFGFFFPDLERQLTTLGFQRKNLASPEFSLWERNNTSP